jgi:plasmid maintenance system antidote protein VapI
MSKSKPKAPITDLLRQTIIDSGIPLLRLSNETGVARASLIRFLRNETSLRLDVADKLADHFGLELAKRKGKE